MGFQLPTSTGARRISCINSRSVYKPCQQYLSNWTFFWNERMKRQREKLPLLLFRGSGYNDSIVKDTLVFKRPKFLCWNMFFLRKTTPSPHPAANQSWLTTAKTYDKTREVSVSMDATSWKTPHPHQLNKNIWAKNNLLHFIILVGLNKDPYKITLW